MAEPLLIGVDGGGTRCRARLSDMAGRVLGEGTGGPANVRLDPAGAMRSIAEASEAAAAAAGLPAGRLSHAHAGMGLAGAAQKRARDRLLAEPHPFASVTVETDAHAAWLGAFGGEDGAILIIGTGSCGLAHVGGRKFDVGGWGAEVSDEASGNWLGREALRRAMWAFDGRAETTPLSQALLARFGNSAEAVVAFATDARSADYAALAPLVFEHAGQGDPLALALVREAAADAVRIIDRLIALGAPSVALIGGIAGPLSAWLPQAVRERLAAPRGDALDGALLMARQAASKAKPAAVGA